MSFANPSFRYVLAGGASLAVLALVLTNSVTMLPAPPESPIVLAENTGSVAGNEDVTAAPARSGRAGLWR